MPKVARKNILPLALLVSIQDSIGGSPWNLSLLLFNVVNRIHRIPGQVSCVVRERSILSLCFHLLQHENFSIIVAFICTSISSKSLIRTHTLFGRIMISQASETLIFFNVMTLSIIGHTLNSHKHTRYATIF